MTVRHESTNESLPFPIHRPLSFSYFSLFAFLLQAYFSAHLNTELNDALSRSSDHMRLFHNRPAAALIEKLGSRVLALKAVFAHLSLYFKILPASRGCIREYGDISLFHYRASNTKRYIT